MMIDKGGPAFPTDNEAQTGPNTYHFEGMTLRDYFAAKALQGIIGLLRGGAEESIVVQSNCAECAYKWADSMMKARG